MANTDEANRAKTIMHIAQLKFRQTLKLDGRQAPLPSVSPEASAQFFSDLDAFLKQNTAVNIQKCTEWIVRHICPSESRVAVFGEYVVSVSKSLVVVGKSTKPAKKTARNRFDLLLLASDVFHADKFHPHRPNNQAQNGVFTKTFIPFAEQLIELVAEAGRDKGLAFEEKLKALLNFWFDSNLVVREDFKRLQLKVDESLSLARGGAPIRKKISTLPEHHGDKFAPWYELPAAYMLEQMITNPTRPIVGDRIKVAKLGNKPVSPHVQGLLDDYFDKIDMKFLPTGDNPSGETDKYKLSVDPLGQMIKCNKETGESETPCNGYGWSMKFCQDMRKFGTPESVHKERELRRGRENYKNSRLDDRSSRSRSPRRRPYSSSGSEYERDRGRHGRPDSSSSYDSRDEFSRSSARYHGSRQQYSRSESNNYERGRRFDNRQSYSDQRRQPADRNVSNPRLGRAEKETSYHSGYGPSYTGYGQAYSQAPQPQFHAPPYPSPQMPHQHPGQFGAQGLPPPPPPPFQTAGGFGAGVPMPSSFNGQYSPPPPPNMGGFQNNNPYNNYGTEYGNAAGYAPNPGNFQGAGGSGRGYHNSRPGYRGAQRSGRGGGYRHRG